MERYNGIERYIFSDSYTLLTKHVNMQNTDKNWETLINDSNKLVLKYNKHPLSVALVNRVIMQIENKLGNRKISNMSHEEWENILKDQHTMGW